MRHGPLRVIVDPPLGGPENMGIDDALLAGVSRYAYTLRLYRWARPTVSLGYGQPWLEGYDPAAARRLGVDLVRRRTGGRAVLHHAELTYSLVGPADDGPLAGGIHATYRAIADGLARGLRALGAEVDVVRGRRREASIREPGPCFAVRSRYEIVADGRKLLGSAQRRAAGRVLQHGSLPLERPDPHLWEALGPGGAGAAAASAGLAEVAPTRHRFEAVARALAGAMGERLSMEPVFRPLARTELPHAAAAATRYRDPGFTRRR